MLARVRLFSGWKIIGSGKMRKDGQSSCEELMTIGLGFGGRRCARALSTVSREIARHGMEEVDPKDNVRSQGRILDSGRKLRNLR